jgi:Spy/CpxP family protein refolding chaperone
MKPLALSLAAALVVLLAHAHDAQAQGRARGGLRMGNVAPVQLLQVDEVQEDLKLTDEQKKAAQAVHEEFMTGRREIFAEVDKDSGERGPKMKELRDKTAEKVAEVLEEPQKKRLQEIVLQVNGASELENKKVAETLKITDEQKKALAEVRKANAKARRDALAALEAGGEGSRGETLTKLQQEGDKKLLEVLTPEQQKQFTEMQGKKLELELFPA